MQELRFVAVSEDGSYAVLAISGRSGRFMLPIDDRLRAVARGQFSRLAQYEIEVENPLRPKEIQARIRAGETVEEIADAAGIPVERVRWFEGPVLAERAYVAEQARGASVRRQGDSTPGPRLGEVVAERLTELGADPEDAQWDSRKHGDGSWQVQLAFRAGGRLHIAEWLFDPRRRHISPTDDNAARLSLPEAELPAPAGGSLGAATVTPIRRPERQPVPQRRAIPESARAAAPDASPARPASHAPDTIPRPDAPGPAAAEDPRPVPRHERTTDREPVPVPAAQHQPAPAQPQTAQPQTAQPQTAQPQTAQPQTAQPQTAQPQTIQAPAAQAPAAQNPAAQAPAANTAQSPAAHGPAAGGPQPPVQPQADNGAEDTLPRGRGKKAGGPRGKRSSVPSWDEIMLGNSREPD
jgi:hypothetical protein